MLACIFIQHPSFNIFFKSINNKILKIQPLPAFKMSQTAAMLKQSKKTSHFCIDALWVISKFFNNEAPALLKNYKIL